MVQKWAATRIFRTTLPNRGQIKPDVVLNDLSDLKSYHINRRLNMGGFDDPQMALIIKGSRRLFPSKKRNGLPITKESLKKIMEEELFSIT